MIPLPSGIWLKVAIGAAIFASGSAVGWGIKATLSDRVIAQMERDYANERTTAAEATAKAEADARRIEKGWRDHVASRERDFAQELAHRDRRIADLASSRGGLLKHIEALARYTGPTGDSARPCGYVQDRLEAAGVLLGEADGLAEESARYADDVGEELRLCRGYAEALKP